MPYCTSVCTFDTACSGTVLYITSLLPSMLYPFKAAKVLANGNCFLQAHHEEGSQDAMLQPKPSQSTVQHSAVLCSALQ